MAMFVSLNYRILLDKIRAFIDKINSQKILFIIFLLVVIPPLLYLYFMPIYVRGLGIFQSRRLSLSNARDYYAILSSSIALLGLLLGCFYYFHRLSEEKKTDELNRKRKRIDCLIIELDKYDNLVDELIHNKFNGAYELQSLRNKIERSYETIIAMLEHNTKLLGLNESESESILAVHSFVEQNDILMRDTYPGKEDLISCKSKYIELIQDARRTCFRKMC